MGVEVGAVDESSVDGVGIAAAVVLKGRFAEIGGEGRVGNPSGGLLELSGR